MSFMDAIQQWMLPDQFADAQEREDAERARQQRIARGQAARLPAMPAGGVQGAVGFMNFANAAMAPGMNAHAGAAAAVNDAVAREMQSRAAQAREGRRMQHEKDMMIMRLQGMRGQGQEQMTPEQMIALAVLKGENDGNRRGTVRSKALRTLGML